MNIDQFNEPKTITAIWEVYKAARKSEHRPHLGGSQIGNPCERALFYQFRHAARPSFEGRTLRLFERGDREEPVIVSNLRAVGATVWEVDPDTGKQISFSAHGGHFSLSLDGVAEGLPDAPKTVHTLELKTMNDKNFKALVKDGLRKAKPIYWAQCQIGMHLSQIDRCAFIAVNKNDDSLYMERVSYDPAEGMALQAKAGRSIFTDQPPARLSNDPAHWECKFCPMHSICHMGQPPEVNCRTCLHSTPLESGDGDWACAAGQIFGRACEKHLYNPYMMPWEVDDAGKDWVQYVNADGEVIRNEKGNSNEIASYWIPF